MPHDEITKNPRTVSARTGLPLSDVLDAEPVPARERCERCRESGRALQIRTYRVEGKARRLCRKCSDEVAWEQAERSRQRWAEVQAQRAFDEALAASEGPDDLGIGADTTYYVGGKGS